MYWNHLWFFLSLSYKTKLLSVLLRLAEEYKEQSWSAMSELEQELQQIERQYGNQFGDAEEELVEEETDAGMRGVNCYVIVQLLVVKIMN